MPVARRQVGRDMAYKGSVIVARLCSPCLLAEVDGQELPHFYRDTAAVLKAGMRWIDERIAAQAEARGAKKQ
jgi:hypothetical protein